MIWVQRYQLRSVFSASLWIVPVAAMTAALLIVPFVRWLDEAIVLPFSGFSAEGARSLLSALSSSMLTFLVFVISMLLIIVQVASVQLTPRIVGIVFQSGLARTALGVFAFSYTFNLATVARVQDTVPQLSVSVAVLTNLVSIAVFFFFAQQLVTTLRPNNILTFVAQEGLTVLDMVYRHGWKPTPESMSVMATRTALNEPCHVIDSSHNSGVLLAFGEDEIVGLASKAGCVVELLPQMGDYVAPGDPLFRVTPANSQISADALRDLVSIGSERTSAQDPQYSLRVISDIANRALSPTANDSATAVAALDQVDRLLRFIGTRQLDPGEMRDANGRIRLLYRTPTWEDFVNLGICEIRMRGAGNLQVARRLRAMLLHLIRSVPEPRVAALQKELDLLTRAIEREFTDPEDRESAMQCDSRGATNPNAALWQTQSSPSVGSSSSCSGALRDT